MIYSAMLWVAATTLPDTPVLGGAGGAAAPPVWTTNYIIAFLLLNSVALLVDAFSCILALRRIIRGRGPSGFPLVTLLWSAYMTLRVAPFPLTVRSAMFGAAVLTHGLLVFGIPRLALWMHSAVSEGRGAGKFPEG